MFELEERGDVILLRLCHGKVNAMDIEFCTELSRHLRELGGQRRPLVVTAAGRVFSAGVDLVRLVAEPESYVDDFLKRLSESFLAMFEYPAPVVAAINGHAVAGGCVLASAADYRLIAPNAKIGIPELRVGVALPVIAIEIMRFVAAPQKFQQMVSIGSTWSGEEAVAVGLADEVVDRAAQTEAALAKAVELSSIPAEVYRISKQQMRAPAMRNVEFGLQQFGAEIGQLWHSADVRAAIDQYVAVRLKK